MSIYKKIILYLQTHFPIHNLNKFIKSKHCKIIIIIMIINNNSKRYLFIYKYHIFIIKHKYISFKPSSSH
jgi:hypothetical protein